MNAFKNYIFTKHIRSAKDVKLSYRKPESCYETHKEHVIHSWQTVRTVAMFFKDDKSSHQQYVNRAILRN